MDVLAQGMTAVIATLALCGLLMWWMDRAQFRAGHRVTVSLVDGSVLTGRTAGSWRFGRIRLVDVATEHGEVPGMIVVYARAVLTVQVIS
ncbi:MAG TPA: hypothetical protein VIP82_20785 [Microbacterium sp.]|uniref:hypothetical protein n=1 Tax=Microbacterium sp. TaxID=51671 RepID=UPI002F9453EE